MKVVSQPAAQPMSDFLGTPLSVVFADADAIEATKRGGKTLKLEAPFHVSDIDMYLIVPVDLGLELVDVFRDGDLDLVRELARDSIVAHGTIEKEGKGKMSLLIESAFALSDVFARANTYAVTVRGSTVKGIVETTNKLDVTAITVGSSLLDDDSLASMLQSREYVGTSWSPEEGGEVVDPTYAWSKRLSDGRVGIEMALFSEYDELVALLRPVAFAPA